MERPLEVYSFGAWYLPRTWRKCLHGCGLYGTEIVVIGLESPTRQDHVQLCVPCLRRLAEDPLFAREVAACL